MSDLARHSHANFLTSDKAHYVNSRPHGPAADFNGDGVPDLAVSNSGCHLSTPSKTVSVLLGNGDGTFQASLTFGVGIAPRSVAVGDFNADGKPDLAVANRGTGDISVLINNTP